MSSMTLKQVASFLGVHTSKIEHAIYKEHFKPAMLAPGRGSTREWTPAEVLRLAVFFVLTERFSISKAVAGRMTVCPMTADERADYIVAWSSQSSAEIEPHVEFIKRHKFGDAMQNGFGRYFDAAIVIDPAPIVEALREAWAEAGLDWH